MEVIKYIKEHGIEKLQEQFSIMVTDYPDRVVLNYNQIESPRFVTLVDECRALILRKGTWEVMARSFNRFYNLGESVDPNKGIEWQRIANSKIGSQNQILKPFNILKAIIQQKLDGSLLSLYFDGEKWCVSTRKMAFAEGQTSMGPTFSEVFEQAAAKTNLYKYLEDNKDFRQFTFVFELTGPENRIVTRYHECNITLIGGRSNDEQYNYRELSTTELDNLSYSFKCNRPKIFTVSSLEKLIVLVESFHTLDEGVVLVIENSTVNGSHWRVKCKNPKYVAVAHLRENGSLSPKNVMKLVLTNEHHEYLRYFEEDKKYFDFVEKLYLEVKKRIQDIYEEHKNIESQKDFALAIMPKTVYSFEKGVIFNMRKGQDMDGLLKEMGGKKISVGMNLKQKFIDEFHIVIEDDNEEENCSS